MTTLTAHEKLVSIQSELKAPKSQTNAFGKYKYRSCEDILEAVKPLLKEHGLSLTISDEIVEVGGRVYVKATATISDEEHGHSVTAFARESLEQKGMSDAQITGAASSYARKYALNGLFLIDDTKDSDATNDHKPKEAALGFNAKLNSKVMATSDLIREIQTLCKDTSTDYAKLAEYYKVEGLVWPLAVAQIAIASLKKKLSVALDSQPS